MKKYLAILIVIILSLTASINSHAALNAATVWEVRTTGSANNGGGYYVEDAVNGVDYSQQDGPQYTAADLACANSTTVTSVTAGFTHAMEGNLMKITTTGALGNFVVGYYQIVTYTNVTTVVLDRQPTGAGTSDTLATFYVGGATNHPNTISTTVIAGNTIWIKSGTYVKVGANAYVLTLTVSGGNGTPIIWEGYNALRNDNPIGTNRPYFDGDSDNNGVNDTANSIVCGTYIANIFKYIRVGRCTSHGVSIGASGVNGILFINFKSSNNTGGGVGGSATTSGAIGINIELSTNTGIGWNCYGNLRGCYVHDGSAVGITDLRGIIITKTISETNSSHGFSVTWDANHYFENIIAYNNTGAATDGMTAACTVCM